jgi:hypothetical protein
MSKKPSNKRVQLEVRATLETFSGWRVSVEGEENPVFSIECPPVIRTETCGTKSWSCPSVGYDVFAVRDALFRVDDTSEALAFLQTYGPLRSWRQSPNRVSLSDIRFLRDLRKEFLVSGSTKRDFRRNGVSPGGLGTIAAIFDCDALRPVTVHFIREGDVVVGVIHCSDVEEATQTAVYLDRRIGYDWQRCDECQIPFERQNRHKKKFCSPKCQSYASTMRQLHPEMSEGQRRRKKRRKPDPIR